MGFHPSHPSSSQDHYNIITPDGSLVNTNLLIDEATPAYFIIKLNQITNELTIWTEPDTSLEEDKQVGFSKSFTYAGMGTPNNIDGYTMHEGNWDAEIAPYFGRTIVTNAQFYSGIDTPFAIPESATFSKALGVWVLFLLVIRRALKG